jgi:hypothetical protein
MAEWHGCEQSSRGQSCHLKFRGRYGIDRLLRGLQALVATHPYAFNFHSFLRRVPEFVSSCTLMQHIERTRAKFDRA